MATDLCVSLFFFLFVSSPRCRLRLRGATMRPWLTPLAFEGLRHHQLFDPRRRQSLKLQPTDHKNSAAGRP